ncbi:antibiotic biosynthesis monooxygenase [Kitasatospora sp. NPDC127111]|uniref:antibiotic biosynthesis monooxygenase n=1 Tax=Kitasatospora sp. NPDC127111 TaxID=3345363 RepID=UPI0036346F1D
MPTLPWITPNPATPGTGAVVMASRFEVRSLRDVPRFFLKSLAVWRQLRTAPGALGASLVAQPLKRTFYTLSAWESRDALNAFAGSEPHRSAMTGLRSTMKDATFTFWDTPVERLPIAWPDAHERLAEQRGREAAA